MRGLDFYRDRHVVLAGCSSGIGEAASRLLIDLGARVHGFDWKPSRLNLAAFTQVDLRDEASIAAAGASIGGEVHALFNCAGLSYEFGAVENMKVNFLGTRQLTNAVVPKMGRGSAIVSVASTSAGDWQQHRSGLAELVQTPDFGAGLAWYERHLSRYPQGYAFSKEALLYWTLVQSSALIRQGIRINCTMPGPTQTPMVELFEKANSGAIIDACTQPIDRRATPTEQALPMLFLNSADASYINGVSLLVDGGFSAAMATGQTDTAAFAAAQAALAQDSRAIPAGERS